MESINTTGHQAGRQAGKQERRKESQEVWGVLPHERWHLLFHICCGQVPSFCGNTPSNFFSYNRPSLFLFSTFLLVSFLATFIFILSSHMCCLTPLSYSICSFLIWRLEAPHPWNLLKFYNILLAN